MNSPNRSSERKLLKFPVETDHPLSIRAKAIVFDDPRSAALLGDVERIASTDATVLIVGETGTGKELVARHIHACSKRSGPFVAINCGAFSETLIDAELFGHESGAFTGASHARAGWFETANGGTLFLDEIGDMPLPLQVKLLRVLQERQVVRIGARQPVPVDVRLIAATNVDLSKAVQAGRFRADLYYRINVASVRLPALRERPGDIMPLVLHFAEVYGTRLGLVNVAVNPQAELLLTSYAWPGNIRELENVVHYALVVSRTGSIEATDLRLAPQVSAQGSSATLQTVGPAALYESIRHALRQLLVHETPDVYISLERLIVTTTFDYHKGNQVRAARALSISRNVLRAKLRQLGLLGEAFQISVD
jgi:sigma-54 dependent transcriptional regulator